MTDDNDASQPVRKPGPPTIDKMIAEYKRCDIIDVQFEQPPYIDDSYMAFPCTEIHTLPERVTRELGFNVFVEFTLFHVVQSLTGERKTFTIKSDSVKRRKNVWTGETFEGAKVTLRLMAIRELI